MRADIEAVRAWFVRLYGESFDGERINIVRTDDWVGQYAADPDEAVAAVIEYDAAEPVGVYHRITTVRTLPPPFKRGDISQSHLLPGFWADIDIAGPGHKSKGRLPENRREAKAIVDNSCLPEPSLWVDSGGGLYPWWLLDEPIEITEANLDAVARLSLDLQTELQRAARDLDMECAPMADLARVLRVPGTINRKAEPVMCKIIKDTELTFTARDLREMVPEVITKTATPSAKNENAQGIFDGLPAGPMCRAMSRRLASVSETLRDAENGSRHAAALSAIGAIIWLGNVGHAGAREALSELHDVFDDVKPEAEDIEWPGMVGYVVERMEVITDRHCCGELTFSDAHMAARATEDVLRGFYIWSEATRWMRWTGTIWKRVAEAEVIETVRLWVIAEYRDAVDQLRQDPTKQALADGWKGMLNKGRITAVVALAQGILGFDAADLDADPDILNTPSGVIDLRTGELMDPDASRLVSKITGVEYDPEATDPDLAKILHALPDDVHEWFQIRVGQAATGHPLVREPMVLLQGGGENGKTTLMQAVGTALGSYFTLVSDQVLLGTAQRDETMDLFGARFALIEELPEEGRIDVVRLKKLIDTPKMEGHHLYRSKITWDVTHSLFVTTNPRPQVSGVDHATWRRLAMVRCPYTFVKGEPETPDERKGDPNLRLRVIKKDPALMRAFLRWIVDGAREFYRRDMVVPDVPGRIAHDTRQWRMEADMILAYWSECLTADPGSHVLATDLYEHFKDWMLAKGNKPWSDKVMAQRFGGHVETLRARVEQRQTTAPPTLISRPKDAWKPIPARPRLWLGVKFAEVSDGAEVPENPFSTASG